jgi:hypothetical protein
MQITEMTLAPVVTRVVCDVCSASCGDRTLSGFVDFEFATLSANWGYSSGRDGEAHLMHLCEPCFGAVLQYLDRRKKDLLARQVN